MTGFASVSVENVRVPDVGDATTVSWTDDLGARHTDIEAFRIDGGEISIPGDGEHLVIPLRGELRRGNGRRVSPGELLFAATRETLDLRANRPTDGFVIGAAAGEGEGVVQLSLEECPFEVPATSDIATAWLTEALGCAGMKVNARRLDPGQRVPYHTEGDQEELFIPVAGPAAMRLDDHVLATPVGTVARVAPTVPRSADNPGEEPAVWIMVGAPPTGGPREWDPGSEILE